MGNNGVRFYKWCENKVYQEALKYNTKVQFQKKNKGAYVAALRYGIDRFCKHMTPMKEHFTWEQCEKIYKSGLSLKEIRERHPRIMDQAKYNGWHDELKAGVRKTTTHKKRQVYILETDKGFYVGMTCFLSRRIGQHKGKLLKDTKHTLIWSSSFLGADEAAQIENSLIMSLRCGYFPVLNKTNGGELGGFTAKTPCKNSDSN